MNANPMDEDDHRGGGARRSTVRRPSRRTPSRRAATDSTHAARPRAQTTATARHGERQRQRQSGRRRSRATQDDLDAWMRDYSLRNNGRISREAYMNEVGRRWDAMDAQRQGLSPADVSRLTGRVDSNAPGAADRLGRAGRQHGPGQLEGQVSDTTTPRKAASKGGLPRAHAAVHSCAARCCRA